MEFKFKFKRKDPVEHFVDGRTSLIKIASGLIRFRGIGFIVLAIIIVAVSPFPKIDINLKTILLISLTLFLLSIVYLRNRAKRSLDMKYHLHKISHSIRDAHLLICDPEKNVTLEDLTEKFCFLIRDYFRILTNKEDIGVAVRIAYKKDNKTFYKTIGRVGLNENRNNTSEDLAEDEGIAKLFNTEDGNHGILQINNLKKASKSGAYLLTTNDERYPQDIRSMMVCPINGWDGECKGMLGILYITTSSRWRIFGEKYTDSMGFISDALAVIYSGLVISLVSLGEKDHKKIKINKDNEYLYNEEKNEIFKIT